MEGYSALEANSVADLATSSTVETPLRPILDTESGPTLRAVSLY